MKKLGLEIPDFVLTRRFQIKKKLNKVSVEGIDVDGTPFSVFQNITCKDFPVKK